MLFLQKYIKLKRKEQNSLTLLSNEKNVQKPKEI